MTSYFDILFPWKIISLIKIAWLPVFFSHLYGHISQNLHMAFLLPVLGHFPPCLPDFFLKLSFCLSWSLKIPLFFPNRAQTTVFERKRRSIWLQVVVRYSIFYLNKYGPFPHVVTSSKRVHWVVLLLLFCCIEWNCSIVTYIYSQITESPIIRGCRHVDQYWHLRRYFKTHKW